MKFYARHIAAATLLSACCALAPSTAQAGDDDMAAIVLSLMMPGVGEWYNGGFSGGFPIGECIVGGICPLVSLSSVIDAAAGKSDEEMRFDFWASPN